MPTEKRQPYKQTDGQKTHIFRRADLREIYTNFILNILYRSHIYIRNCHVINSIHVQCS